MGKAGWQVTAAISASLALLMGALAFNTSRALDVANAQLRERATAPPAANVEATPVDYHAIEQHVFRDSNREILRQRPDLLKCIDGQAFAKVQGEWRDNGPC